MVLYSYEPRRVLGLGKREGATGGLPNPASGPSSTLTRGS